MKIGIVGGTGRLGSALARRWALAGHSVIVGSRDAETARVAAADMVSAGDVTGAGNLEAAGAADLVMVTVPYSAQADTLAAISSVVAGKIVIDTTVPLVPPKVMRVQLPEGGSAALRAQAILADATVISAFHNVAAHRLATPDVVDCDVLVFGDDGAARAVGVRLAADAGLRGLHGGALANSVAAEALTSVIIFINKTYGADGAGLRITGDLRDPETT